MDKSKFDDLAKMFDEMSDDEKAQLEAVIEDYKSRLAAGKIDCMSCGKPVQIERAGRAWQALCSCGWASAGQGYVQPRFN